MIDTKELRNALNGDASFESTFTHESVAEMLDHIERQEALIAELRKDADLWKTLLSACEFGELGVYRHTVTDSWGTVKAEFIDDDGIQLEISKSVEIHKEMKRIRAERLASHDASTQEVG